MPAPKGRPAQGKAAPPTRERADCTNMGYLYERGVGVARGAAEARGGLIVEAGVGVGLRGFGEPARPRGDARGVVADEVARVLRHQLEAGEAVLGLLGGEPADEGVVVLDHLDHQRIDVDGAYLNIDYDTGFGTLTSIFTIAFWKTALTASS